MNKIHSILIILMLSACSSGTYNYVMDYPTDAARLSLGGKVETKINCDIKQVEIISDTSNGIFSRHIKNRVKSICYNKKGVMYITYLFDPVRGPQQDILSTQPNRRFAG